MLQFFLQKSLLWMQLGVISTLGKWTERKKRLVLFPGKLQEEWKKKILEVAGVLRKQTRSLNQSHRHLSSPSSATVVRQLSARPAKWLIKMYVWAPWSEAQAPTVTEDGFMWPSPRP